MLMMSRKKKLYVYRVLEFKKDDFLTPASFAHNHQHDIFLLYLKFAFKQITVYKNYIRELNKIYY